MTKTPTGPDQWLIMQERGRQDPSRWELIHLPTEECKAAGSKEFVIAAKRLCSLPL